MRALAALVLCTSLCLIGGCSGNAAIINVDGTWVLLIEFNECPMFGFMKGGASNQISIPITQTGNRLSTQFTDADGVDWTGDGFISGFRTQMWWTGRNSENRVIEIASEGWIQSTPGGLLMGMYEQDESAS